MNEIGNEQFFNRTYTHKNGVSKLAEESQQTILTSRYVLSMAQDDMAKKKRARRVEVAGAILVIALFFAGVALTTYLLKAATQ